MIKDWPRKLTFIGLGASLILWTSAQRILATMEPEYQWVSISQKSILYALWSWAYESVETRYPLAIAIAITIFGAYHMVSRRNSN